MLGPGRYLLGVAEILLLVGAAWLGAARVRSLLLPGFQGAPAHLATSVLALALLIWAAEVLGSFSLLDPVPYLVLVAATGLSLRAFLPRVASGEVPRTKTSPAGASPDDRTRGPEPTVPALIALAIAAVAFIYFAIGAKAQLSTGMTGFDSTWYHGPFAAGFFQSGDTWDLHFIAPQFLAWFYPANGEILHAAGMLSFGRDVLSPLLNIGWFAGCLVACWCIGRPYRVAPWSLGFGALALSVPALADQAGEARNDIVGIFFLLAAVALALNAWAGRGEGERGVPTGALVVTGLAAGLAAGTKLKFLLPAAILMLGLVGIAPRGSRWRALVAAGLAALAGGGYWYLRNLAHSGNPLPWIRHLGPSDLPAPQQALGGREAHSVLGYLGDGTVWSSWFLPDLHHGLTILWPLLLLAALAGLLLALDPRGRREASFDRVLPLVGLVGLAAALAWLVAPTSASGPEGMPRGFESGLRYLAPALVLGLTLLPATPPLCHRLQGLLSSFGPHSAPKDDSNGQRARRGWVIGGVAVLVLVAVAVGYPVQRHYLEGRYADPSFTAPGLNAAFAWAREVEDSRIATTSTRQYPLFGTDLSNRVAFVGGETDHGGFEAPVSCRAWIDLLNEGDYDYVVASYDRVEPGDSSYPPQAAWTERAGARAVLREAPTVVFQLRERLDPSACR